MGLFTKDIATFEDLFLHQLQDVYYAENQITKALPTMIEKATDASLKSGFETHLTETEGQIRRLRASVRQARRAAQGRDLPGDPGHHQGGPMRSRAKSPTKRCSMPR